MTGKDRPLAALAWMTGSSLAFSLVAVCLKRLVSEIPQFELVFFRSAINFLWVVGFVLVRRERIWPSDSKGLLLFRALAGFCGAACMVYSIGNLPLPIANLLNWSSPLFVILISRIVLKERMPRLSGLFLPIAFGGMVMLVDPFEPHGIGLSLKAALAGVGAAAFGRVGVNTIVLYFVTVSSLISAPLAAIDYHSPTTAQWIDLLLMGSAATLGQLMMTQAYRFAPAGVVSMMGLMNPVFGVALGIGLFHESIGVLQWAGILLVAVAIVGLTESASRNGGMHQKEAMR
jgi:drug/metabolite transporter (DMT)-like permease